MLSDIQGGILVAKSDLGKLKLFGGYEFVVFAPPSEPHAGGLSTLGGYTVLPGAIDSTANGTNKHLPVVWVGARYWLLENLDLAAAYYLAHQKN